MRDSRPAGGETTAKIARLNSLFNPESVAVIGASSDTTKWGGLITNHLALGGFPGEIYPVNPKGGRILGIKVLGSLAEAKRAPELAVICRPAEFVKDVLRECAEAGVKFVVMITAGFAETGEDGRRLEQEVVALAEEWGIGMIGPNTMGVLSNESHLLAVGSPIRVPLGGVSIVSQSGNVGMQLLAWSRDQMLGVNKFVSSGNEAQYSVEDLLEYLEEDEGTDVILLYLEGMKDPRRFLEVARRVSSVKPIVAYKAGKTDLGAMAAMSHSGHLAGMSDIASAALRQAGILEAATTQELLDHGKAFEYLPLMRGPRVAVMTRGGGWGVITADAIRENGLELAQLRPETIAALDELLPPFWSRSNPVDLVGLFDLGVHSRIMSMLMDSDEVDAVISLGSMTGFSSAKGIYDMLKNLDPLGYFRRNLGRAFFIIWSTLKMTPHWFKTVRHLMTRERSYAHSVQAHVEELGKPVVNVSLTEERHRRRRKILTYTVPEQAARALAGLYRYHLHRSEDRR
ncbi:MAG: acetate--CoA ligase family protein [Candidatus Geothermincolia bacterium]